MPKKDIATIKYVCYTTEAETFGLSRYRTPIIVKSEVDSNNKYFKTIEILFGRDLIDSHRPLFFDGYPCTQMIQTWMKVYDNKEDSIAWLKMYYNDILKMHDADREKIVGVINNINL